MAEILFPPGRQRYGVLGLFAQQVGLDQSAQIRRYLRPDAEPQLETAHRLMQQHPETVDGAQPARARRSEQRVTSGA